MQHPLSPQPVANAHPWGWETLTSSQSLAYLGVAAGCLLLIVWLVCRLRAISAPTRRTDERRRDESGVATIEFVLVAPFLLGITLILVQTMLVFTGLFYVNYAAYAAARSAIVYIPADLAPDGPNTVTPSEGFEKYDRIQAAAVIAVMPVSGQENGEQDSVNELVNGLNRYFQAQGKTPPHWVENLIPGRFNYAAAHTAVTLQTVGAAGRRLRAFRGRSQHNHIRPQRRDRRAGPPRVCTHGAGRLASVRACRRRGRRRELGQLRVAGPRRLRPTAPGNVDRDPRPRGPDQ